MSILIRNFSRKHYRLTLCCKINSNNNFEILKPKTYPNNAFYIKFFQPAVSIHTSFISFKKKNVKAEKEKQKAFDYYTSLRKKKKVIKIWKNMTVQELALAMDKDTDFLFDLMTFVDNSVYYTKPEDEITDLNVIFDLITQANMRYQLKSKPEVENIEDEDRDIHRYPPADENKLIKRPPVVTIMGHVDHGKTTLLDHLRKSSIVKSEFGGITQHIGAFSVKVKSDSITFLDTPGHAAFSAMRSRGAHCTDIVILVVAADDGVMEQTLESIRMSRNAKVPIVVAINKIDKSNADIERTKKMLAIHGLIAEDLGGDTQVVPISALRGTNIDHLIEAVLLQAELSNLRADPAGYVEGVIIESKVDPHKGKLSTALIQRGTLRKGCILTAGTGWCKTKLMYDDKKQQVKEAPPSSAVEIEGWRELPVPGDIIIEVETEKRAHEVIRFRKKQAAMEKLNEELPLIQNQRRLHYSEYKQQLIEKRRLGFVKLRNVGPRPKETIESDTEPSLNILIKADVEGSLEALLQSLTSYRSHLCKLKVVHYEVGKVSVSDVETAELFNGVIYDFNVGVLPDAAQLAENKGIPIHCHNVIYRFLDDVKQEINTRLPMKEVDEIIGEASVLQLFFITDGREKNVPVAGCRCISGELKKTNMYKIVRDGKEIYRGTLKSMRNLKTEVNSIKKEQECGLRFEDISIICQPGDIIQAFKTYSVPQEVQWNPFL